MKELTTEDVKVVEVFYPKHISSHNREEYKPIDFVNYENEIETSMGNYSLDE